MNDRQKTNEQLIEELETMRQKVMELKDKIAAMEPKAKPDPVTRAPRVELNADIEFIADFDIVEAKGINISESGVCFEIGHDLPFEMQFQLEGKQHRYRAHLIWVKHLPEGGYRIGLKFVDPEPYPKF